MATGNLRGHVALVTGGSRGIGAAIVKALGEAGCAVAVNYRERAVDAEALAKAIVATGGRAIAVGADVSKADAVSAIVQRASSEFGPVDILVNNAGEAPSAQHSRTCRPGTAVTMSTHRRFRSEREQLQLFRALPGDLAPRDAQDLMAYPFFSLAKTHRTAPIDFRMKEIAIRVEAVAEYGMATIWDADVLIWAASQIVEARDAGLRTSRLMATRPREILTFAGRGTAGGAIWGSLSCENAAGAMIADISATALTKLKPYFFMKTPLMLEHPGRTNQA